MDIGEVWKKLESDKLSKPVLGSVHIQKKSKHPIQKLKTAYLQTTGFSAILLIGFIVLFFSFQEPLVKIGISLVIISYVFFFVVNFSMYKKINVVLPVDQSLKTVLTHTYNFITDNIQFQKRVALIIYPIACTAGFMMGGSAGGGNVERMMQNSTVLLIVVGLMVILTPLCYLLTNWMYKISYGKCLSELQVLIKELERVD